MGKVTYTGGNDGQSFYQNKGPKDYFKFYGSFENKILKSKSLVISKDGSARILTTINGVNEGKYVYYDIKGLTFIEGNYS